MDLLIYTFSQAIDEEEGKQMIIQMAQECKTKESASDGNKKILRIDPHVLLYTFFCILDDVQRMADQKMPNTPEGKCLTTCMQEQVGIVSFIKPSSFKLQSFTKCFFFIHIDRRTVEVFPRRLY
jgi:hypothetical protein